MATLNVQWARITAISPRIIARDAGFDLDYLTRAKHELKSQIRKIVTDKAINNTSQQWDTQIGSALSGVKQGVYVIALGGGVGIDYKLKSSNIIYIGRGSVKTRLKRHFERWILDFSSSMSNISFNFYISEVRGQAKNDYYKDAERDLIAEFIVKYGEKPLVNKNHGKRHNRLHSYSDEFYNILKPSGAKYLWEVRPTSANPWFKELRDVGE